MYEGKLHPVNRSQQRTPNGRKPEEEKGIRNKHKKGKKEAEDQIEASKTEDKGVLQGKAQGEATPQTPETRTGERGRRKRKSEKQRKKRSETAKKPTKKNNYSQRNPE